MPIFNPSASSSSAATVKQTEVCVGESLTGTWVNHDSADDSNDWRAVAWSEELGLYASVALNNTMSSPDGAVWTAHASPSVTSWQKVIWAPELSKFVAASGLITMTSTNGTTWVAGGTIASGVTDIIWSPDLLLFVATVTSGGVSSFYTSTDGITWSVHTSPVTDAWQGGCWSHELGKFVVVANTGSNRVATSTDGSTWLAQTASDLTKFWKDVAWSPRLGLFAAVASNAIMTSPDGVTWTDQTSPLNRGWTSIVWVPGVDQFFACSNSANTTVGMASPNGSTWTVQSLAAISQGGWESVIYAPALQQLVVTGSQTISSQDRTAVTDWEIVPRIQEIFTIEDDDITATSHVIAQVPYETPTDKSLDELEMDDIDVKAGNIDDGRFDLIVTGMDGYLEGFFKVNYVAGEP